MSTPPNDTVFLGEPSGFDSSDREIVIVDGPGDTTVRPCRPERLAFLMAEAEKIARWQALMEKERASEKREEKKDDENGQR
jgi:hypothetical protein